MAPRYAELHCHSNFSFLDGASHPHDLVSRAAELGYEAIAVTDHDGFYGAPRFRIAGAELGVATVYGTEVGLPRVSSPVARQNVIGRDAADRRFGADDRASVG